MNKRHYAELTAFAAVLEHGTFVRAATHLGVAAPALSQTIRRLEERLGLRLFNRTTRSVSVTAEGERLAARLLPALAELEASVVALNEVREGVRGTVRINAPRIVALRMLAPLFARFHTKFPEVVLDITMDDSYTDIVAHKFDVGIRLGERLVQDVVAIKFGPDFEMTAVATPRYLKTHGTHRRAHSRSRSVPA